METIVIRWSLAFAAVFSYAACHGSSTSQAQSRQPDSVPRAAQAKAAQNPDSEQQPKGQTSSEIQRATVGDHDIELQDATLTVGPPAARKRTFNLPSGIPCQIHRDEQGNVRAKSVGKAKVVLIECSREKMRSPDGKRRLCETHIHGLVLGARGPFLGKQKQTVGMCPPFQWDDHVFAFFVKT